MKHGGDLTQAMATFGGKPDEWLDLSTGINPWPWKTPKTMPHDIWQRLPSRADEQALLAAARLAYRVPDGTDVVAAAGTQALIQWLPYLAAPGTVAIVGPTYNEHVAAWRSGGHEVAVVGDLRSVPDRAKHVVIVNPNNPDGRIATQDDLAALATTMQRRQGWLVIDEAFADVDPALSAVGLCAKLPVVILRSFGKFYGLAGLRLGFAIAAPAIAQRIGSALGPWACSGPALHIGALALRDIMWAIQTRISLATQTMRLDGVLSDAGFEIVGGTSLFRLVRHANASGLHEALAQQHIWCRSFDWDRGLLRFGLAPDAAALERLAVALK